MANIPTSNNVSTTGAKKNGAAKEVLLREAAEEFERIAGQIENLTNGMETLIKELDSDKIWSGPGAKEAVDNLKALSQRYGKKAGDSSICQMVLSLSQDLSIEVDRAVTLEKILSK